MKHLPQINFFYWALIISSNTLGETAGDLLAHNTPLGFDGSTLLLLGFFMAVVLLFFSTKISRELLYWLAIIITHPVGATMGDFLTKTEGCNLGNINASLILVMVFVLVLLIHVFLQRNKKLLL